MKKSIAITLFAGAALLAGCGESGGEGGLSAEDNRELNEAAAMIEDENGVVDASSDSLVADENAPLGNGEMPAETGELPVANDAATNAGDAP